MPEPTRDGLEVPEAAVETVRQAVECEMRSRTYDRHAYDEEVFAEGVADISDAALAAALPYIRRAVIEELVGKAEAQSAEAYSGFDMLPQHLKGFPEGQRQRSLGVQANHAHWWLRAELEEGDRRG